MTVMESARAGWLMRHGLALVLLGVLVASGPAAEAQRRSEPSGRPKAALKSPADLAADVVRAMRDYRATLERAVPAHEAALRDATAALEVHQTLHAAAQVSDAQLEASQRAWEAARRDLADLKAAMDEADQVILQASVHEQLARLRPLARGGYEDMGAFIRFNGTRRWSLKDVPTLEASFTRAFGRRLPISAFGQTSVHTRIGLDHRDAIDVAVHPDSSEGQWLMRHLRETGIPFIGVRQMMAGSSTGAHIHVGPASPRLTAR